MELMERSGVFSPTNFDDAQRLAKALASSRLVPKEYQNDIGSCLIALDYSVRTGYSPMMVMQNMHIIHGRPSWSASFVGAAIRGCGRFDAVELVTNKEKTECFMQAVDKSTGKTITGPTVSIQMAKDEGWYSKTGSKWKTMPELMLQYRATAFFGRLHASDVLMGMQTAEEIEDVNGKADIEIAPAPKTGLKWIEGEEKPESAPAPAPKKKYTLPKNNNDLLGDES